MAATRLQHIIFLFFFLLLSLAWTACTGKSRAKAPTLQQPASPRLLLPWLQDETGAQTKTFKVIQILCEKHFYFGIEHTLSVICLFPQTWRVSISPRRRGPLHPSLSPMSSDTTPPKLCPSYLNHRQRHLTMGTCWTASLVLYKVFSVGTSGAMTRVNEE